MKTKSSGTNRVYIFVNGILTFPGSSDNWNGKAATWTHINTPHRAEKVEYFISALTRPLFQRKRIEKLARTISYYHGWEIVLVGHSNGCDVICKALEFAAWRNLRAANIKEIHLISAACSNDFDNLKLNRAIAGGQVGRVSVWIAGRDWALKVAGTYTARLIFGYGTLGKTGPTNMTFPGRVETFVEPNFGHSDWFKGAEFERTMKRIMKEPYEEEIDHAGGTCGTHGGLPLDELHD